VQSVIPKLGWQGRFAVDEVNRTSASGGLEKSGAEKEKKQAALVDLLGKKTSKQRLPTDEGKIYKLARGRRKTSLPNPRKWGVGEKKKKKKEPPRHLARWEKNNKIPVRGACGQSANCRIGCRSKKEELEHGEKNCQEDALFIRERKRKLPELQGGKKRRT